MAFVFVVTLLLSDQGFQKALRLEVRVPSISKGGAKHGRGESWREGENAVGFCFWREGGAWTSGPSEPWRNGDYPSAAK